MYAGLSINPALTKHSGALLDPFSPSLDAETFYNLEMEHQHKTDKELKEITRQIARQSKIAELNRAAGRNWKKLEDTFLLLEQEGILVARYLAECGCCAASDIRDLSMAAARPIDACVFYSLFFRVRRKLALRCLPANRPETKTGCILMERALSANEVDEPRQMNLCSSVLEMLSKSGLHGQLEDCGWIIVSGKWPEALYENWMDPNQIETGK